MTLPPRQQPNYKASFDEDYHDIMQILKKHKIEVFSFQRKTKDRKVVSNLDGVFNRERRYKTTIPKNPYTLILGCNLDNITNEKLITISREINELLKYDSFLENVIISKKYNNYKEHNLDIDIGISSGGNTFVDVVTRPNENGGEIKSYSVKINAEIILKSYCFEKVTFIN